MGCYEEKQWLMIQPKLEGGHKTGSIPVLLLFYFLLNLKGDGENEQITKSIKAILESKRVDDPNVHWRSWSGCNFGYGGESNA